MKSILYYESFRGLKFSLKDDYSSYQELGKKISNAFAEIPSTEIWSVESLTSTIRQIEFYKQADIFKTDEDVICLYEKLDELLDHLEYQAECGVKLKFGDKTVQTVHSFKMFVNELIMGDNMILVQAGPAQITYINHSVINYITTRDIAFNTYMKRTLDNITQKSVLISGVNEKDRLMFFNRLKGKIKTAKHQIVS